MKTMTNWVLALGLAGGLGLAASGANETLASGAEGNRAAWMQGRYGIMVHWLYPSEGDIDRWTDNFNVPGFLDDFARSGADWLIFTSGQCRGAYASPNAAFDRYCGVGHTSRRDLLMEIAQGVKAQGKRFIVYAAIDFEGDGCREHAMQRGLGWEVGAVDRRQFEARWSEVLGEWAQRLGKHCDGWWLDGCNDYTYPAGADWSRWLQACRAGNPAAAVAFNGGVNRFSEPWGPSDYMAGEASTVDVAERVVSLIRPLPNCLRHYLFPIDGYWGMYWKWPTKEWAHTEQLLRERPEMFDQAYLDGLRERGEFPQPVYTVAQLQSFLKKAAAAGAGTTLNVGIAPDGRLNPHSLKLLQALRGPVAGDLEVAVDEDAYIRRRSAGERNLHSSFGD